MESSPITKDHGRKTTKHQMYILPISALGPGHWIFGLFNTIKDLCKSSAVFHISYYGSSSKHWISTILSFWMSVIRHIEGILPKGPYLPCVSMASRAILAGHPRYMFNYHEWFMKKHRSFMKVRITPAQGGQCICAYERISWRIW